MAVSQILQQKLRDVLGAHAADNLVEILESMDAHRGDVGELRHEMQLGFARIDSRFEQQNGLFEKALREQTRFFFVAWAVILAAIIGIYSR